MSAPTHLVVTPLHSSGPLLVTVPADIDLDEIRTDVAESGVFAPEADLPGLIDVVAGARARGVDLSVIVLSENPERDTDLRDLATTVGESEGGTVLVLSPDRSGSYSDEFSRVQLETAQDRSFGTSADIIADRFSQEVAHPGPPWALYTVLLVVIVAVLAAVTFVAKWRRAPESPLEDRATGSTEETVGPAGSA